MKVRLFCSSPRGLRESVDRSPHRPLLVFFFLLGQKWKKLFVGEHLLRRLFHYTKEIKLPDCQHHYNPVRPRWQRVQCNVTTVVHKVLWQTCHSVRLRFCFSRSKLDRITCTVACTNSFNRFWRERFKLYKTTALSNKYFLNLTFLRERIQALPQAKRLGQNLKPKLHALSNQSRRHQRYINHRLKISEILTDSKGRGRIFLVAKNCPARLCEYA